MLFLYNSLSKQKEPFKPIAPPKVGMYTCGMTVYDYAHIGHGRKYVGDDVLRRVLTYLGYEVNHVQNITDVGHLVSDADEGEDKLEKGARKYEKSIDDIIAMFTNHFYNSMDKLNVLRPHATPKATEHIEEQIKLVQSLIEKGFAYETPEAVYFDISKFDDYGKLFGQDLGEKRTASREEVETGTHKKHPADFSLWFKLVGRFENHIQHWPSPWGEGFPGWHIECSAMSMAYLGEQLDIHTGGLDHLPVHHPNEIAQSECSTGKQFSKYWVHHGWLTVDGQKMSKSLENFYKVEDVEERGFDPLALRYFYLTAHYRKQLNFTWEALEAAATALDKLRTQTAKLKNTVQPIHNPSPANHYLEDFKSAISDDLNMPQALAVTWEMMKSDLPNEEKLATITDFDQVLGLNLLKEQDVVQIPKTVTELAEKRVEARKNKNYDEADRVREKIEKQGYKVLDTANGYELKPV